MRPFEYLEPETIDEALSLLLADPEDTLLMAGGTALVILMKQDLVRPARVIGLRRLTELRRIEATDRRPVPTAEQNAVVQCETGAKYGRRAPCTMLYSWRAFAHRTPRDRQYVPSRTDATRYPGRFPFLYKIGLPGTRVDF